ncbi:MAG: hypothetical protein JJT89_18450 [Nitriliruptoraceae bacterium]|nr:hypothetical protein [Nitriliruptoraceae bacterium]
MSRRASDRLIPRAVHPGAWWLWALGLAAAASATTNPLILLLIIAVAAVVVRARRTDAPWARSFVVFLKLGLVVILIRVVAQTVFGATTPGTVLLELPQIPLPAWAAGVTLGGPITDRALMDALIDGLRLATVLGGIGAANALANPKRLLASAPAALYEVGVAVVVALSFAPAMVGSVQRIRRARRLRGRPDRGPRSLLGVAMPVLEDALERSLALAAAMDSRGYGRRASVPIAARRRTIALTITGLVGLLLGMYGLLDATGPAWLGLPVLTLGVGLAVGGLATAGRGVQRSRYRPDPWRSPEWVTVTGGLVLAAAVIGTGMVDPGALRPTPLPLLALPLPPAIAIGLLVAAVPAVLTPPPPGMVAPAPRPAVVAPEAPTTEPSAAGTR